MVEIKKKMHTIFQPENLKGKTVFEDLSRAVMLPVSRRQLCGSHLGQASRKPEFFPYLSRRMPGQNPQRGHGTLFLE
jgi:hypothetical protein